jgi:hypothetical protein
VAEPITTPRIVCTKCLKEAQVHMVEQNMNEDALDVWVECHGKSLIGRLSREALVASKHQDHDITLQSLRRVIDAEDWLSRTLETLRLLAQRADKLTAFVRSETADHEGEVMQRYDAAAMALFEAVERHRKAQP